MSSFIPGRVLTGCAVLWLGCGGAGPGSLTVVTDRAVDAPLRAATEEQVDRFREGDALFDLGFREPDGLGPLYIRSSCSACHESGLNGPGGVQKMVVVGPDGVTPTPDQSALPYGHTVRPYWVAGAHTAINAPEPGTGGVKVTQRLGPVVLGRGYLEAIDDAEIERVQAAQAAAGEVSGRINRVRYDSEANPESPFQSYAKGTANLIGRFGVKARLRTLDEFTADAFQGDMGMTSPLRPTELPNPDGLADDGRAGVDVDLAMVNAVSDYLRLLEIPTRPPPDEQGAALFAAVGCGSCHVTSLRTRADYPIRALAGIDAPVYSDLLLHDMGVALADGMTDGEAGPREWRTAPLIGLSLLRSYLHDGRARTLEDAVLRHASEGSEANGSVARFRALSEEEQARLLAFLNTL